MILSNFGVHRTGIDRAGGWLLDSRCVLMLMLMLMRGGRLRFVRQRLLARLVMYHANNLCKSERASSPCTDQVFRYAQKNTATSDSGAPATYRSEERRVGKECVSTCRSRWSPYP